MTADNTTPERPQPDDGHDHQWERGKHMAEAFGIPGNVTACALCGVEKRLVDSADGIAQAVAARRLEEAAAEINAVSAADRLARMEADAAVIAGGRVLVTMHYPLRMEVVSGIMRLVSRSYPNAVVGEDGSIRESR